MAVLMREKEEAARTTRGDAWHTMTADEAAARMGVAAERGRSTAEVEALRREHGPNELVERGAKTPWQILREQVFSVMVLILIGAAAVKGAVAAIEGEPREWIDAGAILAIVVLNVALGFYQEYRAERAMAALKRLAAPRVRVRRDGAVQEIEARELVPGDIVLLEAGGAVPADLRVLEAASLRAEEASLTGESLPVEKDAAPADDPSAPLGDRRCLLYMGTTITYGRGVGLVTATGMRTELGRIAELLQEVSGEKTPLQRRIGQLGLMLALGILGVTLAMLALGVAQGRPPLEMFLAGVAVAVAAIPEGLPAVMTITLALGAQRMLKRGALIRKLPAVETLGSVTTICSDKTGTLTENRMTVTVLDVAGATVALRTLDDSPSADLDPAAAVLIGGAALCSDAVLEGDGDDLRGIGDPTETALVMAATRLGMRRDSLEGAFPRRAEAPFSSERRRMTTVHERVAGANGGFGALDGLFADGAVAFTKGAVDGLLDVCVAVLAEGRETPLTPELRERIERATAALSGQGQRVLGLGYRRLGGVPAGDIEALESDLVFVGLVGMIDPPRAEMKAAVATCRAAGIRPVMITGDHPLTAMAIARELGIASSDDARLLTGRELETLSPEQLRAAVEEVSVFARVAPEHKLRIVEALQDRGHVVAMTGDGVNDAPALRRADIGVAMGVTGTDVTKEASDMVLTDDNFATIVRAVEEGRTIYDNVRKFVKYIVTSNSAEVTVMFLTQLFGMPLPLTTLQILWMNLVTDGVPGLALGLEPTERDAMRRAPFAPRESIFSRGIGRHVLAIGAVLAATSFGVGAWAYARWGADGPWGTMVFMTLTLSQLGHAMAVRSNRESLLTIGLRSNPLLLRAVLSTLALQMLVVYLPPLQSLFGTQPLTAAQLLLCLAASTIVFWSVELEKWLYRRAERT